MTQLTHYHPPDLTISGRFSILAKIRRNVQKCLRWPGVHDYFWRKKVLLVIIVKTSCPRITVIFEYWNMEKNCKMRRLEQDEVWISSKIDFFFFHRFCRCSIFLMINLVNDRFFPWSTSSITDFDGDRFCWWPICRWPILSMTDFVDDQFFGRWSILSIINFINDLFRQSTLVHAYYKTWSLIKWPRL